MLYRDLGFGIIQRANNILISDTDKSYVSHCTCQKDRGGVAIVVEGEIFSDQFIEQQILSTQVRFSTILKQIETHGR